MAMVMSELLFGSETWSLAPVTRNWSVGWFLGQHVYYISGRLELWVESAA
jgi:hypothetical protein